VNSNPDRIAQIVTNLVSNAIDYNRLEGEVCVSTATDSDSAILAVTDTGVGISDEDMFSIFDRFYRVDKSRSRAEGHTGLGLAISKAIVEAEGGTIDATSTVNVGTTFTVRFPSRTT
jgi:signal transduction histidine kinase